MWPATCAERKIGEDILARTYKGIVAVREEFRIEKRSAIRMLTQAYIEKILDYAVSCKVDYAEVFFEDAERTRVDLVDSEVSKCSCTRESGIGVRVFRGLECEYLYSADTREEKVLRLLKEYLGTGGVFGKRTPLSAMTPHEVTMYRMAPGRMALQKKIGLLKGIVKTGKSEESCIVQGRAGYLDTDQRVQIANTEGIYAQERRLRTRVRLLMTAKDDRQGDRQTCFTGPGAMCGPEFLEDGRLEEHARKIARNAKNMLGARPCPVGRMPVIIANGFGGLFFHEACGHSLEGTSVANGCSEFAGKIGTRIASEKVTLVDDGSMAGEWGSLGIDDEGILTRKNVLIESGILKGYLLDRMEAKRMGLKPTGSARRENYRFAPVSRMTNTYIAPGTDKLSDMLDSVDKGVFVKDINAGSVDPLTGEFNFNTGETYLIEKGEITVPLKSATLIGTGREILPKVDMVSDDFALGQGYCYAGSGQIPIGAGQPAVRITEMTVGGKEL